MRRIDQRPISSWMGCFWSGSKEPNIGGMRGNPTTSFALLFSSLSNWQAAPSEVAFIAPVKALWKLSWFLRDFGYDTELLAGDEIEEKSLVGLRGVVKVSHAVVNGTSLLNFDGFAPASKWEELATTVPADIRGSEVAR